MSGSSTSTPGLTVFEDDINDRFNRVEGEIKTIRNDIKTILLRLPAPAETG